MVNIAETENNVFISSSGMLAEHARQKVVERHGQLVTPVKGSDKTNSERKKKSSPK